MSRLALYIAEAKKFLEAYGNQVLEQDIPGLYRINNGPEITAGQLLQQAAKLRDEVNRPAEDHLIQIQRPGHDRLIRPTHP